MSPKPADIERVKKAEQYQSLLAHDGFRLLRECATKEVETRWRYLRSCSADELRYTQGFLDGLNFVLEYADAAVSDATAIREAERADQAAALRSQLEQERARRERSQRNGGAWAQVST